MKVAYKDTDSILYLIETPDLYKDMASFKHLLDRSDHPRGQFFAGSNKQERSANYDR